MVNILTRRTMAAQLLALVGILSKLTEASRAYGETTREVSFHWRVPAAVSDTVKSSLKFRGRVETEHDTKGLPLVVVFIGVILLPSLADAILTLRGKLVQPGLKIDTRGAEIKIDIDPDLPRATILLVDKTGAKIFEPSQLQTPAELIKVLLNSTAK